jgi:hypothetical protein
MGFLSSRISLSRPEVLEKKCLSKIEQMLKKFSPDHPRLGLLLIHLSHEFSTPAFDYYK